MKTLCTLLLALAALCSLQAKDRTVNRPPFIVRNTSTVEIDRIVASDTATVVDIKAFFRPHNWIRISSESYLLGDDGVKYPIRSGNGIALDTEFWMPESGEASFSLIFSALPPSVKMVDFIESDCEDCFKVWGIPLDGKLPKLALPKEAKQKHEAVPELPATTLKQGKAVLSGKLLDYRKHYRTGLIVSYCDLLTGNEDRQTIAVADDGSFRTEVELQHAPTCVWLAVGEERKVHTLFLVPGEETKVFVNLRELSRAQSKLLKDTKPSGQPMYFAGAMAGLNTALSGKWAENRYGDDAFLKDIHGMAPEQYKAYCLKRYEQVEAEIQREKGLDGATRRFLSIDNKYRCTAALNDINYSLREAFAKYSSGLPQREAYDKFEEPKLTAGYYDYVRTIGALNSTDMLYCPGFSRTLKYLGHDVRVEQEGDMKDIFSYMLASPKTSADDAKIISAYRDSIYAGKPAASLNPKMRELRNKYSALFVEYYEKSMETGIKVLTDYMGTDKGLFFDLRKAMEYAGKIADFKPLSEADLKEIARMSEPYYQERLTAMNEKLLETIEANKRKTGFTVNEAGEVADKDLFYSMTSKFKGKVVLVDFWATWCGPCRMAMKSMQPMKEELAGKDVVYVFIAGDNSPKETWENMIPDIHGEHYRVNGAQWTYLNKEFSIQGVPTYLLLDKEGVVRQKYTGFPGVPTVKAELLKLLEQ